ncbi:hypothetical protein FEM48_Zijuj04G0108000 [Ziziphus jujuba var. spinosa]|uniref:HSF-type DNA-binding domain-containing protein n=1 Tax=Ziziphus jujuba var. spinosa TaxID=714518 RepID=A0A978VJG0_ZIZJJ|nr:hypothetical protein FEM48_Zijuj04G0108000 [Ziziphus jujuba var. spinosa]
MFQYILQYELVFDRLETSEVSKTFFHPNDQIEEVRIIYEQGFRKIDPDQWEFANEEFIRGQRHLLKNIHRRKPIHSHSVPNQGNSSASLTEAEKQEYEKEIKRLKHDKRLLQLDLEKHARDNQEFEYQIQSLRNRFQSLEHRQKQLMIFVAEHLQNPEFASVLIHQSEIHNKRRKLKSNHISDESNLEENWNLNLQKENQDAVSACMLKIEKVEKLQSSIEYWEELMCEVCSDIGQEVIDTCLLPQTSPTASEVQDPEIHEGHCSPRSHISSPNSFDVHSSPEMLAGSSNHTDSPIMVSIFTNVNIQKKSPNIDMNTKPVGVPEVEAFETKVVRTKGGSPTKVNDLFWEQCLTEIPGSSNIQEDQSERRDMDSEVNDGEGTIQRNLWWNMNNVEKLTQQIGHLTPAM